MDFVPTFLELAGVHPSTLSERRYATTESRDATRRKMATFRGRDVHAIRGKSWVPFFVQGKRVEDDEMWAIYSSSEPIGWELFARGALRKGNWKIVHFSKAHGGAGDGDEGWELFNMVDDPGETRNLAMSEPQKLQELLACWGEYVAQCGVVWGETASTPGVGPDEAPELWEDELELQKSWMGAKGGELPV
jgi:arylsulfatase A-like enzyme